MQLSTTMTLHTAGRLAAVSILSLDRMEDSPFILVPEGNECSVKTAVDPLTLEMRIQQESRTDFRITATLVEYETAFENSWIYYRR